MPRKPSFKYKQTSKGWLVETPASVAASGKRERTYHKTRDAAKTHAAELRARFAEHGSNAAAIPPALASDAAKAADLLKQWDTTLTQAAKFYAEEMERRHASRPASEACDEWFELRESDSRPRTLQNYRSTVKKIKEALGERLLATITTEQLQKLICPPGATPTTAAANFRNVRAFWLWAAKKGWCEAEIVRAVELPRRTDDKEISVLTPAEAERLLEAAARYYPQAVPLFAVQLFAGVRPEEITKLDESNFSEAGIEMTADVTKKRRRRHINPSPTLSAWLEKYPFKRCPNWKRVNDACRHLAGWEVWADPKFIEGKERLAELGKKWPQDVLRHSHATFAVAAGTDLQTLLFEFGHTEGESTLREHYTGRASKKDALAYFSIVPKGAKKPQTISAA